MKKLGGILVNSIIEKNLSKDGKTLLYRFAYVGNKEEQIDYFKELANLAEDEVWHSKKGVEDYDILNNYITYTFDKAVKDDLVLISDDQEYAAFNTGLLTKNGEDILCMFNRFHKSDKYWMHIQGFKKESDWDFLSRFKEKPKVVTYFSNPDKLYFNPSLEIVKNMDHILEDNLSRFPKEMQEKGKEYISALMLSALNLTLKRCQRNYRIAVPQYYNDKITYLLPIQLDQTKMALAVEEVNGWYRVNTIFTLEMAYKNARLLMKPEADWLEIR